VEQVATGRRWAVVDCGKNIIGKEEFGVDFTEQVLILLNVGTLAVIGESFSRET
jgi:hypothetical protein